MPRLKLTWEEIRAILEANGFELVRNDGSSHRRYRAVIDGRVRFVDLAPHRWSADVGPTMISMIQRQSGLSKSSFRK